MEHEIGVRVAETGISLRLHIVFQHALELLERPSSSRDGIVRTSATMREVRLHTSRKRCVVCKGAWVCHTYSESCVSVECLDCSVWLCFSIALATFSTLVPTSCNNSVIESSSCVTAVVSAMVDCQIADMRSDAWCSTIGHET